MFGGNSRHIPQLPAPSSGMPDFSQTNTPSFESFVKPNAKPAPPIGARLIESRFQMVQSATAETIAECDTLILEFHALEQRIESFLSNSRTKHVAALEAKRADLWSKARAAEDAEKAARYQVGSIQARINAQAEEANSARSKADAAKQNPYNTRFPSPVERDAWAMKRARAEEEAHLATTTLQAFQVELRSATAVHQAAAQLLEKLVSQLQAVDSELSR
jgi:hypothetical protein